MMSNAFQSNHEPCSCTVVSQGGKTVNPVCNGNIRPALECGWKSFDRSRKLSAPHGFSRSAYDEEKCRNVLVRFCAHVPRNFQYKDGIQRIFLILRDHLGDENLDLAGGVLYELIEVDCEHTDDPGAAFQRWRHDHMYRYADLELPHIPHMTTITSCIIPTEKLARWRSEHADRYRFVLSDSSPLKQQGYITSCVGSKKAWLIDHTLFVSTRSGGTHPMRSPNPKEFHEMQWNPNYGATGRLVEERELPIPTVGPLREISLPETEDPTSLSQQLRRSLSFNSLFRKITETLRRQKLESDAEERRRRCMPNAFMLHSDSLFKDKRDHCEITSVPLPQGCQIPNAIFARKFLVVDHGEALSSHLSISQMPTAESKATETIVKAATRGLLTQPSPWHFRGPFTPQLGFDGGLDYQWNSKPSGITVRRFDLEASCAGAPRVDPDNALNSSREQRPLEDSQHSRCAAQLSSERGCIVRDRENTTKSKNPTPEPHSSDEIGTSGLRGEWWPPLRISHPCTPDSPAKAVDELPGIPIKFPLKRYGQHDQNTRLFENIKFSIQTELDNPSTPRMNRQTTIIERPYQPELAS